MTQQKNRDDILREIVSIELRMFMAVEPVIPSACQEQPEALKLMRRASHHVLSTGTLESYLADLQEATDDDRNLMSLKYARIDDLVDRLSSNPLIDRIVEVEARWLKDLEERYPLTFVGRSEFAAGVYLRSELETYSDRTLDLYWNDVSRALEEGRNLTEERYTFLFREIGHDSIDDVERERAKSQ
jgi:hypothetical protein